MTQRTRYFLTGASLVIVAGLAVGLMAYWNANGALAMRGAGPVELAYVPEDVSAVAFADVRRVMDSEFRQRIRQLMPTGEAKDELQAQIGLDLEHDIDTVVAGFAGTDPSNPGGIVLVRGRFDADLMETMAVQHGASASDYQGKRLLTSPHLPYGSGSGEDTQQPTAGALAFLEPGLLALGDLATVQRAIDAQSSGRDVTRNAELMGFVSEIEVGNSAWMVSNIGAMANAADIADIPDQFRTQVGAVQWLIASANVNGGVNGTLRAEARDIESAEQMRDLIRGGLAAGRLIGGEDPRMRALLDSVQLTGMGTTIALSFTLSPELLDVINGLAALQNMSEGGSGGLRK